MLTFRTSVAVVLVWLTASKVYAQAPASSPAAVQFSTFGVEFVPPTGFQQVPEGGPGHISRWAKVSPQGMVAALIATEVEPRNNRTLDEYAGKVSKSIGGTVDKGIKLGGEAAVRIRSGPRPGTKGLRPVEAVLAVHGDYFYVISGFGVQPADTEAAIESVRASWVFRDPASPVTEPALRREAFPLFGGIAHVRALATLRPYDVQDPRSEMHLGAFNYKTGRTELFVHIQKAPRNPDMSFDAQAQGFKANLEKASKREIKLTITRQEGSPPRATTEKKTAPPPDPKLPDVPQVIQWTLLDVGNDTTLLVTVTVQTKDVADQDTYFRQSQSMISQITIGK